MYTGRALVSCTGPEGGAPPVDGEELGPDGEGRARRRQRPMAAAAIPTSDVYMRELA